MTAGFSYWYYRLDPNDVKIVGLVGGIITGLVVFIITFIAILPPLLKLEKYERMGVKGILKNRHEKEYYAAIIKSATNMVRVMGASCTRFVEDFLDPRNEDRILIDALHSHRNLKVQLLVPKPEFMSDDAKSRTSAVEKKIAELRGEFGDRVELRRFPNKAQHSFVISDQDLIAGPIFEGDASKYAPAVHVSISTPFAQKYYDHFETIWNACDKSN